MKESTDVFVPLDVKAVDVYGTGAVEKIVAQIEEKARSIVPDVSGDEGRAAVKAIAYRVARSKTFLDGLGKNLVADLKAKSGAIDKERRMVRDRLDALRDDIRRPVTEWEEQEQARIAGIRERLAMFEAEPAEDASIDDLRRLIAEAEGAVVDGSFEEYEEAAKKARAAYLYDMQQRLQSMERAEDEALLKKAERACALLKETASNTITQNNSSGLLAYVAERLEGEAENYADQYGKHADLVALTNKAAVSDLRHEAERAKKQEQEQAAEAARKAAEEARKTAEAEAKAQREEEARRQQAELQKVREEREKAERARIQAEERARIQAEEAAAAERLRMEEEERKKRQEELARQRDKENRERIRSEIEFDLDEVMVSAYIEEKRDLARMLADELLAGNIRHVKVMF